MRRNLYIVNLLLVIFSFLPIAHAFPQEVPHPINNSGIYDFLDELANDRIITINSAVKPYSRLFIAKRLKEADEKREVLSTRQQKELDFYLMDFGKELEEEWRKGTMAQRRNGGQGRVQWFNLSKRREGERARGRERERARGGEGEKGRRDLLKPARKYL